MTKEWKNGNLCTNCALNYKQQNFDACEIVFDKIIEGVFQGENEVAAIKTFVPIFLESLDKF